MAYRVPVHEPLAPSVARVALSQLDSIALQLTSGPSAHAVHDARKALKRTRALLALLASSPARGHAKAMDRLARDVGRMLSARRDQEVLPATITKLETRFGLDPRGLTSSVRQIMSAANVATAPTGHTDTLSSRLKSLHSHADALAHTKLKFGMMADAAARTYDRGRRLFKDLDPHPDETALHDLRKAAQMHWRHMALLSSAWPGHYQARVAMLKELSQILGEHQDLAVLRATLAQHTRDTLPKSDAVALASLIQARQDELYALARPFARLIYHEKPKQLARALRHHWDVAQEFPGDTRATRTSTPKTGTPGVADVVRIAPRGSQQHVEAHTSSGADAEPDSKASA